MTYFLGIDGGGTKTKCILIDEEVNVLFELTGGASNPLSIGISKSAIVLSELIKKIFSLNNKKKINSIIIGLAGAGRKDQADEVKREVLENLSKEKFDFDFFDIVTDAEATLEGAFEGKSGAILIAGTGSIVFGKDKSGKIFRAGGYGKIIGDEGSGYSIARKGLNAVAKQHDGFVSNTILASKLKDEYNIFSKEDLINKVYAKDFDVASVAKIVIECADAKDKICRKIIGDEIKMLIEQIKLLKEKMNTKNLSLAFSGGLTSTENYFMIELKKKIITTVADVRIKKIKYPAEIGAALLAKKYL